MIATLAFVAALIVQPDTGFDRVWAEHGGAMQAEGISEQMGRSAFLWAEMQVLLGQCRAYLNAEDVGFWRRWWDDTSLGDGPLGRGILDIGRDNYTLGLERAISDPIAPDHCQRAFDSWMTDMRAATAGL